MTITGPCPGNDPLKSEGHPKNLLKKISPTDRHAALAAFSRVYA